MGPGLRQGLGDREETLGVKAANTEPALVITTARDGWVGLRPPPAPPLPFPAGLQAAEACVMYRERQAREKGSV